VLLNVERAHAYMRQCGLDALIATSPTNVRYVAEYDCWLDPLFKAYMTRPGASSELGHNYAVLPAVGEPALVLPAIWAANAANSRVQDVWPYGLNDLDLSATPTDVDPRLADLLRAIHAGRSRVDAIEALHDLLVARGLAGGRVGIELEGLGQPVQQRLKEALPQTQLLDCSNLLRLIRMVKSAEELRRLERSTQINYQAARASLATAQAGTTMRELRQQYMESIVAAGAQLDHFIAAPGGAGLQAEPDYRLADGDVMYVDFGCIYAHYYSDNGTTLAVGAISPEFERLHAVLRAGLERGLDRLRPGVRASEVRLAMIDALAEGSVSGSNAHGHGIGLEVRDYPIIVADTGLRIRDDCIDVAADLPLEAGMVVNLELPLYLFGVGSLHMEQTFLLTPEGWRRLDSDEPTEPVRASLPRAEAARA
jgi:Xaa-Pro aminopeptidase